MARCRYCSPRGWAVRTDPKGLCRACRQGFQEEVTAKLAHVRHAQDLEFQLSLCDVALESVARRLPYEERRLAEITPLPSSLLMMLQTRKDEAAEPIILRRPPLQPLHSGSAGPPEDSPSRPRGRAWASPAHAGPR